jgi:Ca2+-transporting ATPase
VHTEIGKIGQALQTLVPELSADPAGNPAGRGLLRGDGMALCVLVTVLYGLLRGDWLNGLLAGITLAMANLPEEFPSCSRYSWRSARGGFRNTAC